VAIILLVLVLSIIVPLLFTIFALFFALIFNFALMLYTIANQIELGFINNGAIANRPPQSDFLMGFPRGKVHEA